MVCYFKRMLTKRNNKLREKYVRNIISNLEPNVFKYFKFSDKFNFFISFDTFPNSNLLELKSNKLHSDLEHIQIYLVKVKKPKNSNGLKLKIKQNMNSTFEVNIKFGEETIYNMKYENISQFYSICGVYIKHVQVRYESNIEFGSTNHCFGINSELIDILNCIKQDVRNCCPNIITIESVLNQDEMKIFEYFLIDGLLKFNTMNEVFTVLTAFAPAMWLETSFFKIFIGKHVTNVTNIFETIHITFYESYLFQFATNDLVNFRLNNLQFTELQTIFETIGCNVKNLKLSSIDNYCIKENSNQILNLIKNECIKLETFEISLYVKNSKKSYLLQTDLLGEYQFLNQINLKITKTQKLLTPNTPQELDSMIVWENYRDNKLTLACEWMRDIVTCSHIEEILKQQIGRITLASSYTQIKNWKFIRKIQCNEQLPLLRTLRKLNIEGNFKANEPCIGELFSNLYHLNNKLSLKFLSVSSYTFEEYNPRTIDGKIKLRDLCLKSCTFGDNANDFNALNIFESVVILQLHNTTLPSKLFQSYQNLFEIQFVDCESINDDRIIQIYETCEGVSVRNVI